MWRWFKMNVLGIPDYEGFARSLRRLKDECEETGIDFKPLAEMARDMVNPKHK